MAVFAVLLVGARLVGLQVFTVISGSMEPTYHVGSLIYVQKVDPFTLQEGDPITFMISDNTVATHRIIEVLPDENDPNVVRFRTKGDNNDTADTNPVHSSNVLGKVVFSIPYLGYVADYIQHPPGTYIMISAMFILILAVFVPDIVANARPNEEDPPDQITAEDNEKLKAELESLKQKLQQQTQTPNQKKEGKTNEEL